MPGTSKAQISRTINATPDVSPTRLAGGQPILEPIPAHSWESCVVLNPAATLIEDQDALAGLCSTLSPEQTDDLHAAGGACVMIYRAQGESETRGGHASSSLGLALFTPDLRLVYRHAHAVIEPSASFHNLGVEDPRCTRVGDTFYLYYIGYFRDNGASKSGAGYTQICLATSTDLVHWDLKGPASGNINDVPTKNAALLPVQVDGKWLLLHRPMIGQDAMAVHLAESENPEGPWKSLGLLFRSHHFREFEQSWVGAGGPPISLGDSRFVCIYHMGHRTSVGAREYDLAAGFFYFSKPDPLVSRIEPLMRPESALEKSGDHLLGVDNVLFTCANYVWKDQLMIPYAGADSRIFGASVQLSRLVEALERTASGAPLD